MTGLDGVKRRALHRELPRQRDSLLLPPERLLLPGVAVEPPGQYARRGREEHQRGDDRDEAAAAALRVPRGGTRGAQEVCRWPGQLLRVVVEPPQGRVEQGPW